MPQIENNSIKKTQLNQTQAIYIWDIINNLIIQISRKLTKIESDCGKNISKALIEKLSVLMEK